MRRAVALLSRPKCSMPIELTGKAYKNDYLAKKHSYQHHILHSIYFYVSCLRVFVMATSPISFRPSHLPTKGPKNGKAMYTILPGCIIIKFGVLIIRNDTDCANTNMAKY